MKKERRGAMPLLAPVLVLSCLAFTSAAKPQDDPLMALPSGAFLVASVGNPQTFLSNAAAFAKATGIEALVSAVASVADAVSGKAAPAEGNGEDLAAMVRLMDPAKRIVLAMYPASPEDMSGSPSMLMFLPMRDVNAALKSLQATLADKLGPNLTIAASGAVPGYLTVSSYMAPEAIAGAAYAASPASLALSSYPPSSLALWVDAKGGADTLLPLLPGGLGSMLSGAAGQSYGEPDYQAGEYGDYYGYQEGGADNLDPDTVPDYGYDGYGSDNGSDAWDDYSGYGYGPSDNYDDGASPDASSALAATAGLNLLMQGLTALAEGVVAVDMGLIVEADRVWLRTGLAAAPGTKLGDIAASVGANPVDLSYLGFCDADALAAGAWSMPSGWQMDLVGPFYRAIFPDPELADLLVGTMDAYSRTMGPAGSISLNLSLSPALTQAIRDDATGDDAMELVSQGLKLDAAWVSQVKDRAAFRAALADSMDLMEQPGYAALMESSGVSLDSTLASGTTDGMEWDRFSFSAAPAPGAAGPAAAQAAFTDLLYDLIGSYEYWYKGDKAFCGMGAASSAKTLAVKGGAARPLAADPSFKSSRRGLPADARGVFWLSTRKLAALYLQLDPPEPGEATLDLPALGGMLSWFSASKPAAEGATGSLGFGLSLGAGDLKAIAALAAMGSSPDE